MSKKKKLAWPGVSRRSVTPRDLSNTGSPAGFPKTRAKKRRGMLRIKSAMLSLCLCECGPHSPIATETSLMKMMQTSKSFYKPITPVIQSSSPGQMTMLPRQHTEKLAVMYSQGSERLRTKVAPSGRKDIVLRQHW